MTDLETIIGPAVAADGVAEQSAAVREMAEAWRLASCLVGGTAAMRKAGEKLLPRWTLECEADHRCRLNSAVLFPAYARTCSVLTGKPFSKPITIGEDVPDRLQAWLKDVDTEGRNLHAFAADLCFDALAYGLAGILVDAPPAAGARTVAEEQQLGIRPYFVHVKHDAILGWRAEKRGSSMVLTQLRLMEKVEVEDGRWATKVVDQVRVLEPGKWATYRKAEGADGREAWQLHDAGTTSIDVVPFVPVYGLRKDFMVGRPPMLDLAYLNVQHWQSSSDQQNILRAARVPILVVTGVEGEGSEPIKAGAIIHLGDPNADMKYVEHTGSAIEAGRLSLLDLEDQMRQVGAELLVIKPGNTTEVQTRQDNEPAMCDLQRIMQSLEDALDAALYLMARYVGEPTGGHVSIYSDFGVATLAEASAQLLADVQERGGITHTTLLNELKRRGVLAPEVDVDREIAESTAEHDAMQAKAAAREQANLLAAQADAEMAGYTPFQPNPNVNA